MLTRPKLTTPVESKGPYPFIMHSQPVYGPVFIILLTASSLTVEAVLGFAQYETVNGSVRSKFRPDGFILDVYWVEPLKVRAPLISPVSCVGFPVGVQLYPLTVESFDALPVASSR
jgi:hypothetical protein